MFKIKLISEFFLLVSINVHSSYKDCLTAKFSGMKHLLHSHSSGRGTLGQLVSLIHDVRLSWGESKAGCGNHLEAHSLII